jgi:uncharacterized lipoprotein YajG
MNPTRDIKAVLVLVMIVLAVLAACALLTGCRTVNNYQVTVSLFAPASATQTSESAQGKEVPIDADVKIPLTPGG